jgi:PhnB protein
MNRLQPYLFFGGRCEEAVKFYERVLGAKVEMMMNFSDSPDKPPPGMIAPGFEKKVMHASLRIGDDVLMCSDGSNEQEKSSHVSLSLSCATNAEVDKLYAALSEGGRKDMPPAETFWSPYFGMLTDKFGIGWMVGVEHAS